MEVTWLYTLIGLEWEKYETYIQKFFREQHIFRNVYCLIPMYSIVLIKSVRQK